MPHTPKIVEDEIPLEKDVKKAMGKAASPDAPTVYNQKGAGQSLLNARFDLIDGHALFAMASVLDDGAKKYGVDNWRGIPVEDHINHLIMHAYAYLTGDGTDDHLSHIFCRAMFALGVELQEDNEPGKDS
jgi:hypothetical protein